MQTAPAQSSSTPLLLQALHRQPVSRPPLWLMRQAGRYLPEYRAIRAKFPDFLSFCLTPDAATEATLQPIQRFDLDAAIIFADILTIPHALGHRVTFTVGDGPRVQPFTHPSQLELMRAWLPELPNRLAPITFTVRQVRQALPKDKAVIGFSGAPWTLACYLRDNKPSQGPENTLKLAEEDPATFQALIDLLTDAVIPYLRAQIDAGADVVQIFDSWAGACPEHLWETAVQKPLLAISRALHARHPNVPVVLFARQATQSQLQGLLAANDATGFSALSLSQETDLAWAAQTLQPHTAIQGNLDPLLTTLPDAAPLREAALKALQTAGRNPGYVMNLGHGLTPQTQPARVAELAELVRNWSA